MSSLPPQLDGTQVVHLQSESSSASGQRQCPSRRITARRRLSDTNLRTGPSATGTRRASSTARSCHVRPRRASASIHSSGSGIPHKVAGPSRGTSTTTIGRDRHRRPLRAVLVVHATSSRRAQADQRVGVAVLQRRPPFTLRRAHPSPRPGRRTPPPPRRHARAAARTGRAGTRGRRATSATTAAPAARSDLLPRHRPPLPGHALQMPSATPSPPDATTPRPCPHRPDPTAGCNCSDDNSPVRAPRRPDAGRCSNFSRRLHAADARSLRLAITRRPDPSAPRDARRAHFVIARTSTLLERGRFSRITASRARAARRSVSQHR